MKSEIHKLVFKRFEKENYEEYKRWFQNDAIKNVLYSIDVEWLDFVLKDETGVEYAVFSEEEMIAVIGIELPAQDHPEYAIKNIAIEPSRFRQGLGSLVLEELVNLHSLKATESWIAYVENNNIAGQHFFEKNGWIRMDDNINGEDMIRFEKRKIKS